MHIGYSHIFKQGDLGEKKDNLSNLFSYKNFVLQIIFFERYLKWLEFDVKFEIFRYHLDFTLIFENFPDGY